MAQLDQGLWRTIGKAGFSLYYQPKASLRTAEILGWEALVSWKHPGGREVPPVEFVPPAEQTRMIVPLGWWVLQQACRQTKEWQDRYPRLSTSTINVNVSARQFYHRALTKEVGGILEETGLSPSGLCMEITESAAMEDTTSPLPC